MKRLAVRVAISVPGELRDKMLKERNVNWSRIAQDAFRAHITKGSGISPTSTIRELQAEIERLRNVLNKIWDMALSAVNTEVTD